MCLKIKTYAFTLAEVLITLGIIGVISALVIPTLINNYNKHITETRLLKFYSAFNQAIRLSVAENGEVETWNEYWALAGNSTVDRSEQIDAAFTKYLKPYMNVINSEVVQVPDREIVLYYLSDGSAFGYLNNHIRDIYFYPANVMKCIQKNTAEARGTCMFNFIFDHICNSSNINNAYYCKKGLQPNYFGWDGVNNSLYSDPRAGYGCNDNENGIFCTAIIKENGWKIPQDYPRKIAY